FAPGLEDDRLVSQVCRGAADEPGKPVRRAEERHDAGPVDPLRRGIDFADPDPRPALVQADEDGIRVGLARIMMAPQIAEAGALDLGYPVHRRERELDGRGRPDRFEAHVGAAALEAEPRIDDMGMHPELVCTETPRTGDQLVDVVSVAPSEI